MMKTITLYYNDLAAGGTSDKEYSAQLVKKADGYVVNFQYGRRGGTLTADTKTKLPVPLPEAERIFARLVNEKQAKGYKPSTVANAAPLAAANPESGPKHPVELLEEITETEADALIHSERYWLQVKVDGHRVQIEKTAAGNYAAYTRNGTTRALPAEVVDGLEKSPLKSFVMDGELVGACYIAFDLLTANGVNLMNEEYAARYGILLKAIASHPNIRVVTTWKRPKEKLAGMALLRRNRCEGAVFKSIEATYRIGRSNHKKFKFVKSVSCRVEMVGFKSKDNAVLTLLDGKKWLEVGRASTIGKGKIEVGQIVEVKFLYATEGKRLYQPRITSVRTDLDYSACTLAQLNGKYKEGCAQ
jgi:bifunctional non-homologous end joining protein LigD